MLARLGTFLSRVFRHTAPDPFVLAILLTVAVFVVAWQRTGTDPGTIVAMWSDADSGVWKLLGFGMQMCLILVTGFAIAASKPVAWALRALSGLPKTGAQGALLVAFVACVLGVLQWGLGLIAGALLARDVIKGLRRRGISVHAPIIAAAGYTGMLVFHGGFSGSAPIKMTIAGEISDVFPEGVAAEPLALTDTILSPMNLVATGGLVVFVPILFMLMSPKPAEQESETTEESVTTEEFKALGEAGDPDRPGPLVWFLERTPVVNYALALIIGAWAFAYYLPGLAHSATSGALGDANAQTGLVSLTPNTLNMTFLLLALLLHGSPMSLVRAVEDAARGCAGIILQFPLYAGIMGVIAGTGLLTELSGGFSGSGDALPLLTMGSAALVNLFVPSGGGQWAIQGPIAMEAATTTGVSPATMTMAVAYGDQLTNMLQPFWALPLLAITNTKAREIVGYTCVVMLFAAVWLGLCLLVLG